MKNKSVRKSINVDKPNHAPIFEFKQLDNVVLKLSLFKDSVEFDITGQTIKLGAKTNDGLKEQTEGFTINKNNLDIDLKNSILVPGGVEIDLELKDVNGTMTTASFFIIVKPKVLNDKAVEGTNEFDTFTKTAAKIEEDYKGLRRIIIDENQAANLQDQVNQTNAHLETKANKDDKIKSSQLDIAKDSDKIKLVNLSDEVQQALTGNAPALSVIPNKSVTIEKLGFVTIGKNKIDIKALTSGKKFEPYTTNIVDDLNYSITDYIAVEEGEKWSCNYMYGYTYYNNALTPISGHIPENLGGTNTITIPSQAKYIRINLYKTLINITQFEEGDSCTEYEKYYSYIDNSYVERQPFFSEEIPDKSISSNKIDFIRNTVNMFNYKTTSDKGWWVNNRDGQPEQNEYTAEQCYSSYIEVSENSKYSINEYGAGVCFYDTNKNFLSYQGLNGGHNIINTPINSKFIRVTVYYDYRNKVQIEEGETSTEYTPYGFYIDDLLLNENKSVLNLPNKYYLVVDDTFELFYKGMLLVNNPLNYNVKIECLVGNYYTNRFIFKPTINDIGTHNMTITVYDDKDNIVGSKTVSLIVKDKATNPTSIKNILCVGDSLTVNGVWVGELKRRLTATDGTPTGLGLTNINFVGSCDENGVKFEGYGGWTFNHYLNDLPNEYQYWITITSGMKGISYQHSIWRDINGIEWKLETFEENRIKLVHNGYSVDSPPTTGSLTWVRGGDGSDNSNIVYSNCEKASGNPFWNNTTGQLDMEMYANKIGITTLDICYVLLGWNSTTLSKETYKSQAKEFTNLIRSKFPSCKICFIGLQVPSKDGLGENYGCSWNYIDKLKNVFNYNDWYLELTSEIPNSDFIHLSSQFDSDNNMPTSIRQVNIRNSKTEVYGTNGVHPTTEGYLQIADAVYRDISHKI